ncbi:MAG: SsrA-binding protein SmpB [Bacteroidaceae bacterium]|nr:SsrA-binding protein SmpB [Bacteroidaceae bacterium]
MGRKSTPTPQKRGVNIKNKRAEFDFLLFDKFTAGIVLTGTEIKSIRAGKASLVETYCIVNGGEVWVKNMYVAHYEQGSYNNHVERRDRKLLLNRKEIRKIAQTIKNPGFSLVPTLLFIDENGLAKLDIYIVRGKKEYDKRQSLKAKDDRREMDRQFQKKF